MVLTYFYFMVGNIRPMLSRPIADQLELLFLLLQHTHTWAQCKGWAPLFGLKQSWMLILSEINPSFPVMVFLLLRSGLGLLLTSQHFGHLDIQCFSHGHVPAKQGLKQSIVSNNISCFFLDASSGRVFYSWTALFDKERLYKIVNPQAPCNSQQGFDMPIDAPAMLDSTIADTDAIPHMLVCFALSTLCWLFWNGV